MSVLQKITAKSRRGSLHSLGSATTPMEEDEAQQQQQQLLEETKQFLQNFESKNEEPNGKEDAKLLRYLCELLEHSLTPSMKSVEQLDKTRQDHSYETWAAGGPQSQRQRKLLQQSKLELDQNQQQQQQKTVISMGTIREEHEHEGVVGAEHHRHGAVTEKTAEADPPTDAMLENGFAEHCEEFASEIVCHEDAEAEPCLLRVLPHLALVGTVLAWLLAGAVLFRWIDAEIGAKSFPRSIIWCFQLVSTIGWGDTHASNTFSQAFTIFYILLGIPMLFSAYANMGRALTEVTCAVWPKLTRQMRKMLKLEKDTQRQQQLDAEEVQRMPPAAICVLFTAHNLVGLLIYSVWLKQWPVVSALYYSITTMATSGFGDYHPDTDSWMEVIVAMLYLSVGITLLSALFLTIALHYQTFHHVHLKCFFARMYYSQVLRDKKVFPIKNGDVENCGQQ